MVRSIQIKAAKAYLKKKELKEIHNGPILLKSSDNIIDNYMNDGFSPNVKDRESIFLPPLRASRKADMVDSLRLLVTETKPFRISLGDGPKRFSKGSYSDLMI